MNLPEPTVVRVAALPLAALVRWQILALRAADGMLHIARASAPDGQLLAWLDGHLDEPYVWMEAPAAWIEQHLAAGAEDYRALDEIAFAHDGDETPAAGRGISLLSLAEEENPVVRLVNSTLHDAIIEGASDIHFEATGDGLVIKFRIDGMLGQVGELREVTGRSRAEQVVSRIKVLAELDIAETRIPQDGRFKANLGNQGERTIDFRVSVMPSLHGEDVVLRILDKGRLASSAGNLSLAALGFADDSARTLRDLVERPHGMVLVTGPTGSGKTTSLYALLMETGSPTEKTVTIEDPVEYQLPGVLQIPVNEKKGLTFARGLRSILRHDPDRILVGEIRDPETAEIAVQAALTGHLVLSSVHANGVFEVVQRFTHMGVDLHALTACLNGIVAQRLVRINCPHCREPQAAAPDMLARLGWREHLEGLEVQRGRGCAVCRGSGFSGRRAIAQILVLDDELREAIVAQAPVRQLKTLAAARGSIDWLDSARPLLMNGNLSLEEARRVLAN